MILSDIEGRRRRVQDCQQRINEIHNKKDYGRRKDLLFAIDNWVRAQQQLSELLRELE